jgi:L-lactate dehydrogenase complex protein LldG
MSNKNQILKKISEIKPGDHLPLPVLEFQSPAISLKQFTESVISVGGNVIEKKEISDWNDWLIERYGLQTKIYSDSATFPGNLSIPPANEANLKDLLNTINVAVLRGKFGVCENGAIWVENVQNRAIPFIAEHLILILDKKYIIPTMHEAYDVLTKTELPGFGTFISGPSKTADIEQSLVYGAQGPKSLIVILDDLNE